MGRSTVLLKGLSSRLGIPWSLSKEWAPTARAVLAGNGSVAAGDSRVRFRDVLTLCKTWVGGKAERAVARMPTRMRSSLAGAVVRLKKKR